MTSIITEAEITITRATPPATLRVADRFTVMRQGGLSNRRTISTRVM
jgi:hypothetical protein